jgi:S-adenosylmethionine decarboxylase proenzyme
MHGLHLTVDLRGCAPDQPLMRDPAALRERCRQAVAAAGLRAVGELFHAFPAPGGVTGVVLLAESHLAVHTWPELNAVTLDVYVCNLHADNSARAEALLAALEAAFPATRREHHRVRRGAPARG